MISPLNISNAKITDISDYAYNLAADIEKSLGSYKRRNLLIRHVLVNPDGTLDKIRDSFIKPTPRVILIGPKVEDLFKADDQVKLNQEDFLITGIPVSYSYDFLFKDVEFYIINPVISNNLIVEGIVCNPILRYEKKLASRRLVLRQNSDFDFGNGLTYYNLP